MYNCTGTESMNYTIEIISAVTFELLNNSQLECLFYYQSAGLLQSHQKRCDMVKVFSITKTSRHEFIIISSISSYTNTNCSHDYAILSITKQFFEKYLSGLFLPCIAAYWKPMTSSNFLCNTS